MSSKFPVASSNKNGVSSGHWQVMMHLDNNLKDIIRAIVNKRRDRDYPLYWTDHSWEAERALEAPRTS